MKRSKIITQQPRLIENSTIIDLKSITMEHPNTSHKLCKLIRQPKKIASSKNSPNPLYGKSEKGEKIFDETNAKIMKRSHAYASTYNLEILDFC